MKILPNHRSHSFHTRDDQKKVIEDVFKAYGLEVTLDDSIKTGMVRMDMDDATFESGLKGCGHDHRFLLCSP